MRVIVANSKKDTVPEVIQRVLQPRDKREIDSRRAAEWSMIASTCDDEDEDDVANLSVLSKRYLRAIPRPVQQLLPILSLTATTMGTLL